MSNKMLENEIERLFKKLEDLTPGSKEYNEVQDCLNILYKLKVEEDKNFENAKIQKEKNFNDNTYQNCDLGMKERQAQKEFIFNCLRFGVDLAGIILPFALCRQTWKEGLKIDGLNEFVGNSSAKNAFKFMTPWRKK